MVKKINAIDTSGFVKKHYDFNINEIKGNIPSITGLATTAAVSDVKNKIPKVNDLVKKTDYDAKIKDIEDIYFTKSDYNKWKNKKISNKSRI